jgi:shikimate dehydrogenase
MPVVSGKKKRSSKYFFMATTKDTQIFISIAERPGNFGANFFNQAFLYSGLDYIYKPFKVLSGDLQKAIDSIRVLGIRGAGVSMPHKQTVIQYLDEVDERTKKIGAVNTIVNKNGRLYGYNTDYVGAHQVIEEIFPVAGKKVLIIGAGGAARAIIVALQDSGAADIMICNRHEERAKMLAQEFDLSYNLFHNKEQIKADLLINATSVGMNPQENEMIVNEKELNNFSAVMDVVIYPSETRLLSTAKLLGKTIIYGQRMTIYQAAAQFKLYTGQEISLDFIKNFKF